MVQEDDNIIAKDWDIDAIAFMVAWKWCGE